MPAAVKTPEDEKTWAKAKEIVRAMGVSESDKSFWPRVMAKFEDLKKSK